ncbi:MAG: choice-of-anchor Q domain-containing protein [Polyangiales bacterium]
MRRIFRFVGFFALSLVLSLGCSQGGGEGGGGGTAGTGGSGGMAGSGGTGGMPECRITDDCDDNDACTDDACNQGTCSYFAVDCDDRNDCTTEACDAADGCTTPTPVADGTPCAGGTCQSGACELTGSVLPCTEQGIRNAIAAGGGPYSFDCAGPQRVVTQAEILIDNDVILDGEANLTVDGDEDHRVFVVAEGITAELRGFTVTKGSVGTKGGVGGEGGGIYNSGGTLTLTNSTVSGNTAEFGGGGIYNYSSGTLTVTNSTVSGNTVFDSGGGIWNETGGTLTVTNTLVDDVCGGVTTVSGGHNIESPGDTCGFDQPTDQVNVSTEDLNLGPLADNGGPTMTHALLTEPAPSVAIDWILAENCVDADGQPLTTDQRGEPRPETGGTMCDIGAFEVQP